MLDLMDEQEHLYAVAQKESSTGCRGFNLLRPTGINLRGTESLAVGLVLV